MRAVFLVVLVLAVSACGGAASTPETARPTPQPQPVARHTLSVAVAGDGRVVSVPAGIDCPGTCTASFDEGTSVSLSATPGGASALTAWGGACSGNSCSMTLRADASVSASFDLRRYRIVDLVSPPGVPSYWAGWVTAALYWYTYDAVGRLTDVTTDGNATSHYEYDANGNRLVGPGLTTSPVYDNQDRLLSYGSCTYTYTADGSLQVKTCPDGTTTYDYDAFGNLGGVTLANGTRITYLIDGQNRRIGKRVNGTLVESFLYEDDIHKVGWYDGSGALKAQFVFGSGSGAPEFMIKGPATYRLILDQVGTVRFVVDSTGVVAQRLDYDEFGNIVSDSAPGFQPLGFASGHVDRDTGLIRFGARDFDPTTGRWDGRDPLIFGGADTNLYRYANGDPINYADPSGLYRAPLPINPLVVCIANPLACAVGFGIGFCTANPSACGLTPAPPPRPEPNSCEYTWPQADPEPQASFGGNDRYTCTATCNVDSLSSRITGAPARGSSEYLACKAAKTNANQVIKDMGIPGTYKRHCKCDCSKR